MVQATIDQICSPTHTLDVAKVIEEVIETEYYGTYNVSNHGEASRYEFFREIALLRGLDASYIVPIKSTARIVKRAQFTAFDPLVFRNTFKTTLNDWKTALRECIERIDSI